MYPKLNLNFFFLFTGASSKEDEPFEDRDDTKVDTSAKGKKKASKNYYFDI